MKQLKHYSYLMALMFILAGGIISCAGEEDGSKDTGLTTEPTTCRVSVSSGEGGTATTSETEVMPGWEVILTATPETTYRFVNWTVSGNEVSKENPYRAIVKTSTQFRANFEKDNYKVSVKEAEGGSVKASQKGDVLNGTKVTFTATPQEGFSFISWIVNGNEASKSNPYTITITENTEVQASFITHKVTVLSSKGGTAKASKMQVGHNAQVTFTATPQENYGFVNWTVNGEEVSTQNPYTTTITKDLEIKANFATLKKITILSSKGGTATASKTQAWHNEKVTFTASPQDGYYFVNWTVNGTEVSKETTYTATITKDIEIKANFATLKKITILSSKGGTAKASKTQVVPGEEVTFTATPQDDYYLFVNWTVNGEEVSKETTYTATITEDIEIKANFITITSKITIIENEGGTATASCTQLAPYHDAIITANPSENYYFYEWYLIGCITFDDIRTNPIRIFENGGDIKVKPIFRLKEGIENGHNWVDLGLPCGVKWATCNVGATTPEEYGDYFAWGETEPKSSYTISNYKYSSNPPYLPLSDDAASVNWGGKWRMPTKSELEELIETHYCTWTGTTQNGVSGYKVTSKQNGNSIFLPAAGYYSGSDFYSAGVYWSRSLVMNGSNYTYDLNFGDIYGGVLNSLYFDRYYGKSVRAVCP